MYKSIKLILFLIILSIVLYCNKDDSKTGNDINVTKSENLQTDSTRTAYKVKFIELGSVSCIPCKMMQPVMDAIEKEFGSQVKVVFHDVWKDTLYAKKYKINLIPTQIFLDESGKEFFRHEGFLAQKEIEKLLINNGLSKIKQTKSE